MALPPSSLSSPRPQPLDQLLDLPKSLLHLRERARESILRGSLVDGDFEVRDGNSEQLQQATRLFARHGASSRSDSDEWAPRGSAPYANLSTRLPTYPPGELDRTPDAS